jgi:hypothetical protein
MPTIRPSQLESSPTVFQFDEARIARSSCQAPIFEVDGAEKAAQEIEAVSNELMREFLNGNR